MQTLTANKVSVFFLLFYFAGSALANDESISRETSNFCAERPAYGRCHWIKGTVSIYNGTPSIRIKLHENRKLYAVGPAEQEQMPVKLKAKLTLDNSITGKFLICPLPVSKPRGFEMVCVQKAILQRINNRP
jgi:hypothetical protein